MIHEELILRKFAKKPVLRLSDKSTLWDVLEMMNDFRIRHIPIVKGSTVEGVVNPLSVMGAMSKFQDPATFDVPALSLISSDYLVVNEEDSLLDIIREIAERKYVAALMMRDCSFNGIYTEMDILGNNYLWRGFDDITITTQSPIGMEINEFTCVSSTSTIFDVVTLMHRLQTDIMGVVDAHAKILTGTISFMDIVQNTLYQYKEFGVELYAIWSQPINTIFPQSGVYLKEPVTLTQLRNLMKDDSIYLTILLDELNYPQKLISVHDLIALFTESTGLHHLSSYY